MNQLVAGGRRSALAVLLLLTVAGASACSSIRLISDYDPIIDESVTALQKDVDTFLTQLERPEPPTFDASLEVYEKLVVDLRAVQVRAGAQPQNSLTIEQLDLVAKNLDLMKEAHREGIEDPAEIELFRDAFQAQFRAILTLELAKRRGE
jgi:hypothetical protein